MLDPLYSLVPRPGKEAKTLSVFEEVDRTDPECAHDNLVVKPDHIPIFIFWLKSEYEYRYVE